jgi:hypothetical protein
VQGLCWLVLAAGVVIEVWGVVGLATHPVPQREYIDADLVPLGVIVAVLGWFGTRRIVRCDRDGVRVRWIRTKFVPVGEIRSVEVRPAHLPRHGPRGVLKVIRRDGSVVRLGPTLTERVTWAEVDARLGALAKRMRGVLGLPDPLHPH